MLRKVRVDGLSKSDSLVVHVENTIVVFKEVDSQVSFTCVASRSDLQHTVSISIDNVLVLRNNVVSRLNRESQIWHCVKLLNRALGSPETHWV